MESKDTIIALATPVGRAGVGIIRLSGSMAYTIALQLTKTSQISPRSAHYSAFYSRSNELIDKGIILFFKAPHSFTGEDIVEIQAHGSPVLLDFIIQECVTLGARLAKPGEFSERAFLNDKIDLAQAEAIADLIQSQSLAAAKMAVRSLEGDFSKSINQLNETIINLRLYVEASIDFPEEEIDFLGKGIVSKQMTTILQEITDIRANAAQGVLMREGLAVVIAGKPNAGKSTLINCLAGREVAIVTDIAGTTRDVMREHILIDELPIHIMDTAGLCESQDIVEQEGVRRALQEVRKADCILMVVDLNQKEAEEELLNTLKTTVNPEVPIITVYNKCDIAHIPAGQEKQQIFLSAKTGEGIALLKAAIKTAVGFYPTEGKFMARRRHLQALDEAITFLLNGQEQVEMHKAYELLAEDLRLAHQALCEITGEFSSDDLLGRIFSSFCIGK